MAADAVVAPRLETRTRRLPAVLSAGVVLAGAIAVSAVVRFLLALSHPTPIFFADEYIYSTLAHELATTGAPTIRGEAASFPALLQPLLTAPFWLFDDAGVALRLTQALNAVAMSLAAVPVYLLARKLELGKVFAVAAGMLTLLVPDLFYVAFVLAEPIAYPLVLGAVYAGVCALSEPTRRNQLAFVALAGLASFARIQFVVLPLAFVLAALVARTGVRRLRLTLALFAVAAVPVAVKGLGYYSGIADFDLDVRDLARWVVVDSMLLAYAAGWVVIPGALVALASPRGRVERAFAALVVFLGAGLFAEAALYATNANVGPGGRFQERYLFTLLPLAVLAFGLSLRRESRRVRIAIALIAAVLVAVAARWPLSGWTDEHGRQDSPFLIAVYRLEEAIGYANGSLLVAAISTVLAAAAVGLAFRPRFAPLVLGVVGVLLAGVAWGAWSLDSRFSQRARATYLPADARWVDHADVGRVTMVNTPGAPRQLALEQLFWNRSIDELVRLRQAGRPDAFAAPQVRIARDGSILLRGRPLRNALLLNEYAVTAELRGARSVGVTPLFELWRPTEGAVPRLRMLAGGRYYDGWLANSGYVHVWDAPGRLTLRLQLPQSAPRARIVFRTDEWRRVVTLAPGETRQVTFPVGDGFWKLRWKGPLFYLPDLRPVSVRADELRLDPA